MLYLVATPIGNLEDITLRALRTLREADFVVCEDTRHSGILLKKYEIKKPLLSFHSHSNEHELQKIIHLLKEGKNLAYISDAGMPGISDPGFKLIQACIAERLAFTVIPGASAVTTAVVISGLPANRFLYLGYLPLKHGRKTLLASLKDLPFTLVCYESPHRLLKTLREFNEVFQNRKIAICRELTKMFEEVFRGEIREALAHFELKKPKGEFTIILGPPV